MATKGRHTSDRGMKVANLRVAGELSGYGQSNCSTRKPVVEEPKVNVWGRPIPRKARRSWSEGGAW